MRVPAIASVALISLASATEPSVTIDSGPIAGTAVSLPSATVQVNQFLGIPFAQSPPERFSPPAPPQPWNSTLKTQAWKPACIQQFNYPEARRNFTIRVFNKHLPPESEDCLYLNVYAPASPAPHGGRAVMYWIYGGSLMFGTGSSPGYNGSAFAAYEDVVLVTMNYRTNVFGFPGSPELPRTGENLGFLDQRAGLQWVQRNIEKFGGNPDKVTIFGESAGARSVDSLLTSYGPDSNPPFRAAILQSGQVTYRPEAGAADPYAGFNKLAAGLNCTGPSNLACVRAAPALMVKEVIERQALSFSPMADNYTLVSNPEGRRTSGQIKKLPVMCGTTAQEGRAFQTGATNLTAFFQQYFYSVPDLWPVFEKEYASYGPGVFEMASQIYTEYAYQCTQAKFANASLSAGIPTHRFYFNATFPNTQGFPNAGVYHSSEIPLVFSTYEPVSNSTVQEIALSNYMRGAWADFAKNPEAGPGWIEMGSASEYPGAASDEDLAVLGNVGSVKGAGATMIKRSDVDSRCYLFERVYDVVGMGR